MSQFALLMITPCWGLAGVSGATGAGVTGPTGVSGVSGAAGATGATGVSGASGALGATGATGVSGASGAAGATGATGANSILFTFLEMLRCKVPKKHPSLAHLFGIEELLLMMISMAVVKELRDCSPHRSACA